MNWLQRKIPRFKKQPHLPWALGIAIGLSVVLTCVSTYIYYQAGFYKFDLSRPGFEAERNEVSGDTGVKTYDTTSPVTTDALQQFLNEHDARTERLNQYNDFGDNSLADEELLLKDKH